MHVRMLTIAAILFIAGIILTACGLSTTKSQDPSQDLPSLDVEIIMSSQDDGQWSVQFDFREPQSAVIFPCAQDDYRRRSWTATSSGTHVRHLFDAGVDLLVLDPPSQSATFTVEPWFEVLPRDYTPALFFSHGGIAFHLPQFEMFAMPSLDAALELEPDLINLQDAPLKTQFHFDVDGLHVVNGDVSIGPLSVGLDDAPGYVYLGPGPVTQSERFAGILDPDLPVWLQANFENKIGEIFTFLEARHKDGLSERVTILLSMEPPEFQGESIGGSTMPGPLLTMTVGGPIFAQPPSVSLKDAVHSTLAHEAAHLFQKRYAEHRTCEPWIHEGHASAVANDFMGLETLVNDRERQKCLNALKHSETLPEALYRSPYECGAAVWNVTNSLMTEPDIYRLWDHMMERRGSDRLNSEDFIIALIDLTPSGHETNWFVSILRGEPIQVDLEDYLIHTR